MKKYWFLGLFFALTAFTLLIGLACSVNPTGPSLRPAVQTIVAINPTFTFTNTFTPTWTPTPSFTPTPYVSTTPWVSYKNPSGLAVDSSGNIYVADTGNNAVEKFSPNGVLYSDWGNGGKGRGKIYINQPQAVAVQGPTISGSPVTLYVLNANGVSKFDDLGNPLVQFTPSSVTFTSPQGIAVDGSGNIFVSDNETTASKIFKLSNTGSAVTAFGTSGIFTFGAPVTAVFGLAVDDSQNIWAAVANSVSYGNILELDANAATVISTITGFNNPHGITFNGPVTAEDLFVADSGNHQVEEFLPGSFTAPSVIFNDGGKLSNPVGVGVDSYGNVYVADSTYQTNGAVFRFTP